MKKVLMSFCILGVLFVLSGCGENVITTKTCTSQDEGYTSTYTLTATNKKIDKVKVVYLYENSLFGVETLSTLTDEQKEQIKTNMLNTLGLESDVYEGFEVTIDIQDQMTVTIDADLTQADSEVLKKVGLDFSDTNMNFDDAISSFEGAGAICK